MINPDILNFLDELSVNNNKEWFDDNRPRYQSLRENFIHNIDILIHNIAEFDKSIKGLESKKCIFRINRDIRFSKDKSPYKTNFGAFIAPGGRNNGRAGYYLHLEPGNCFLAGGIYMPPSPILKAIRQEIFENYSEFLQIVESVKFKEAFGAIDGEKLKTKPKDFPSDFEGIEHLKFKHYTVIRMIDEKSVPDESFLNYAVEVFSVLYPFNRFLNYAIEHK